MAEIFDLIARIGWDTNSKELERATGIMRDQDKVLEELRRKGGRLEDQIRKTNDPKLLKAYNDQLQEMRKRADAITNAQKQQLTITESLRKKQKELHEQLRANNDPKMVQGLLQNLGKVENQLTALTSKASASTSKIGGLIKDFAGGFGLGVGMVGAGAIASGLKGAFDFATAEFQAAETIALRFQNTLRSVGKERYFNQLINEADRLADKISYLDNDDIVSAQEKLITYGKLSIKQITQLTPIIIDLAARIGTDLPSATELVIGALEGQGRALKQYGISLKDAETFTDRLALVHDELGKKVAGSAQVFMTSQEGIRATTKQTAADIAEDLGEYTSKIDLFFKKALLGFFQFIDDMRKGEEGARQDEFNKAIQGNASFAKNLSDKELNDQVKLLKYNAKEIERIKNNIADLEIEKNKNRANRTLREEYEERIKAEQQQFDKLLAKNGAIYREFRNRRLGIFKDEDKPVGASEAEADKAVQNTVTNLKKAFKKYAPKLSESGEGLNAPILPFINETGAGLSPDKPQGQAAFERIALNEKEKKSVQDVTNEIIDQKNKQAKADNDLTELEIANAKERAKANREALFQQAKDLAYVVNDILRQEQDKTSRLISEQEDRVEEAKKTQGEGAKASVKIEEDRLNELIKKRQQYERTQRIIDAAVIVANQAVAISGAIRQIATAKNPLLIAANVAAILAGIGASVVAVRSAFSDGTAGFRDGGYTGDGNPDEVSTAQGQRGYKYHRREFVMTQQLTDKHRELFEGIHTGKFNIKKTDEGYYIGSRIDTDKAANDYHTSRAAAFDTSNMVYELQSIKKALAQREVNVQTNFDAEGFTMATYTQLGQISLRNKLAKV